MRDALRSLSAAAAQQPIDEDAPEYDQKVLSTFMVEGRLKSIPTQQKKRDVILRFLARRFEPQRMYDEREVNEILREYHDDVASLRRYLVDTGLLQRQIVRVADMQALMEGSPSLDLHVAYWKPAEGATAG
jgi:hypothetical protein